MAGLRLSADGLQSTLSGNRDRPEGAVRLPEEQTLEAGYNTRAPSCLYLVFGVRRPRCQFLYRLLEVDSCRFLSRRELREGLQPLVDECYGRDE